MSKKNKIIITVSILLFIVIIGCVIFFVASYLGKSSKKDDNITLFKNGYLAVKKDGNWGVVNKKGKTIIPFEYEKIKICDLDNLFLVKEDGKYGFINNDIIYVINNDYEDADVFSENGLAPVEKKDKWGYIDKNGKYVVKPKYDLAFGFYNDTAVVSRDDKNYLIDEEGSLVFEKGYDRISNINLNKDYYVISDYKEGGYKDGIIDKNGKVIIVPQFDYIYLNENDTANVEKNKKTGVIDLDGEYILKPEFDSIYYSSSNKIFTAKKGDIYNIYDESGKKVADKDFENDLAFADKDVTPAKIGNHWGYVNAKGEEVIAAKFDDAKRFGKYNLAPVKIGKTWEYINLDGRIVDNKSGRCFEDAEPFDECGFAYVKINNKWGIIDKSIKVILEPKWRKCESFYSDVMLFGDDEKNIYIINKKGETVGDTGYEAFGNDESRYCKKEGCYEITSYDDYCYNHMDLDYDDSFDY